jgi:hypothetical protein
MSFNCIAEPEQLTILAKVLDDYCLEHGITDASGREQIGRVVMWLFNCGASSAEELKAGLRGVSDRNTAYAQRSLLHSKLQPA